MKVPTYQSQARIPGSAADAMAPMHHPGYEAAERVGAQMARIGEKVANRFLQLKEEQDALDILDTVNKFADEERVFMVEEFKREGAEARGGQERAQKWYEEKAAEYTKDLSGRKKQVFLHNFSGRRETALNNLAMNEARQHRVYQGKTLATDLETKIHDVSNNPGLLDEAIAERVRNLQSQLKGPDLTANINASTQRLVETAFMSRINNDDFEGAAGVLKKFKKGPDALNPKVFENLERIYESKSRGARIQSVYDETAALVGFDHDKALDKMHDPEYMPELSIEDRNTLKSMFKADRAERQYRETKSERDLIERENTNLFEAWAGGMLTKDMILKSKLPSARKTSWMGIFIRGQERKNREIQSKLTETDKRRERNVISKLIIKRNSPAGLAFDDLLAAMPDLSTGQMNYWSNILKQESKKKGQTAGSYESSIDWFSRGVEQAKQLFPDWEDQEDDDADNLALFVNEFDRELRRKNMAPNSPEAWDTAKELLQVLEESESGFQYGFSANLRNFLKSDDFYLFQIPEKQRNEIKSFLEIKGKPATSGNIYAVWKQLKNKRKK